MLTLFSITFLPFSSRTAGWPSCRKWLERPKRVLRGASWNNSDSDYLMPSLCLPYTPELRYYYLGLRVVLASDSSRKPNPEGTR